MNACTTQDLTGRSRVGSTSPEDQGMATEHPIIPSVDDTTARVERIRARGGFDRAEVCVNGHAICVMLDNTYNRERPFCGDCGARTIQACESCSKEIRGARPGRAGTPYAQVAASYTPPAFCDHCGQPHPWTRAKLKAGRELADDLLELTPEEREQLKASIDDIISDTPATDMAVLRVKRAIKKLPAEAAAALRKFAVDVASEAAKKALLGQ